MNIPRSALPLPLAALLLLSGCAGGGRPAAARAGGAIPRPSADLPLIVKGFDVSAAEVPSEEGEAPWIAGAKKNQARDYIAAALVRELRSGGLNSMPYIEGAAAPDNALIIDGAISAVSGGKESVSIKASARIYAAGSPANVISEFGTRASAGGPEKWDVLASKAADLLARDVAARMFTETFSGPSR